MEKISKKYRFLDDPLITVPKKEYEEETKKESEEETKKESEEESKERTKKDSSVYIAVTPETVYKQFWDTQAILNTYYGVVSNSPSRAEVIEQLKEALPKAPDYYGVDIKDTPKKSIRASRIRHRAYTHPTFPPPDIPPSNISGEVSTEEVKVGNCYFVTAMGLQGIFVVKDKGETTSTVIKVSFRKNCKKCTVIEGVLNYVLMKSKSIPNWIADTHILKSVENSIKAFGNVALYKSLDIGKMLSNIESISDIPLVLKDGTVIKNLITIVLEDSRKVRIHPDDVKVRKFNINGYSPKKRKTIQKGDEVVFKKNKKIPLIKLGTTGKVLEVIPSPFNHKMIKYVEVLCEEPKRKILALCSNLKRI